jgi:cell division protein FtsZ
MSSEEDLLNFGFKHNQDSIIKVIGVGGGGGNALNYMYRNGISGVDFIICNTDAQALENSPVPVKVQLGVSLTEGRGAGNKPEQGEQAAIENLADIRKVLANNTRMVFITAGMGGGTGTGAAPVIAQLAREMDILTIAVVTLPSEKEGKRRFEQAMAGVNKLKKFVDSLLVISNENLHKIYGDLPASKAFAQADNILATAVKGCAEIITLHGNINIDFADVNTVMRGSGVFIMGSGIADGEDRAMRAVKEALISPLLDSNDIYGTENILLNITSGDEEILMGEIGQIIDYLQDAAGDDANIIWGNGRDEKLGSKICVTLIATGFQTNPNRRMDPEQEPTKVSLQDAKTESAREEMKLPLIEERHIEQKEEFFEPVSRQKSYLDEDDLQVENDFPEEPERPSYQKKNQRKKSEEKKHRSKKEKEEVTAEPITNWFVKQFNTFFSDNDMEMDE